MHKAVEEFYISYNIPFKKHKDGNMYETQNSIIKIRQFSSLIHEDTIKKLITQINKINEKPVYIYIHDITNESNFMAVKNTIESNCINVNVICNIDEYYSNEYSGEIRYGIIHTGAVWTLVSNHAEMYNIINGHFVLIPSTVYARAIVIMTDNEIELLNTYNINVIDGDLDTEVCYITRDTYATRTKFIKRIDYVPLEGGNRIPMRVIEGVTDHCPNCNRLVYIDRPHNCFT